MDSIPFIRFPGRLTRRWVASIQARTCGQVLAEESPAGGRCLRRADPRVDVGDGVRAEQSDEPAPRDQLERELVHPGNAEIVLGHDLVDPLAEQGVVVVRERAVSQVACERIFNIFGPLVVETAVATCGRFRLVARLRARPQYFANFPP